MDAVLEYPPNEVVIELIARGIARYDRRMVNGKMMDMVQDIQTGGVKLVNVRGNRTAQMQLKLMTYSPVKWTFNINLIPKHLRGVVLCSAKSSPKVKLHNGKEVQILSRHDAERCLWDAYREASTKPVQWAIKDLTAAHRAAAEAGVIVLVPA